MTGPFRLNRALIRVAGPDARSFLNGLLTQSVDELGADGVRYAALLSPQGKIVADMFVWAADDGLILEADPARGADLARRLTMYKLRAQVAVEDVTAKCRVLWAPEAFRDGAPDPRLPALGWRRVRPSPSADAPDGAAAFDAHRLALGVPDLARDAEAEEVFALEALLEELHGVDFHKGCFVGQENVSRMKRRATTRKKFCPIVSAGPAPAFGTPVRAGASELGSVRTGANGRAIALLRLDRALEALEKGEAMTADGRAVRLDPPEWLILPDGKDN